MGRFDAFTSKDFIEQVSILGSLDPARDHDSIPDIVALLGRIPEHEAIVLVMKDTLKKLFSGSETSTVRHLADGDREIQKICIEVAGRERFASATAALKAIERQASERKHYRIVFEVMKTLAQIRPEESIDLFRKHADHEDSLIASLCIETLGALNDAQSLERMHGIIMEAEDDSQGGLCDLPTASAVRTLGTFQGRDAVAFFITILHHRNPGVRRVIHEELSRKGAQAVDALREVFRGDSSDAKIFAANILGLIGSKEAADVLVQALDTNRDAHPNIRYAVYEALGCTPGMAGLVCLADGLEETDGIVLLAVVTALDMRLNQSILDRISETIRMGTGHGRKLVQAIVASGAMHIFEGLYRADEAIASMLLEEIGISGIGEHLAGYRAILEGMDSHRAKSDLRMIDGLPVKEGERRILAVDDSKAMLNFYKGVAASLGMGISTAMNGKEALDVIALEERFDLIITDMNMPVMDGVEFTGHVRRDPALSEIPIIMITTESERSQEDLARKAGVTHFMQKPFDAEKLMERITGCL